MPLFGKHKNTDSTRHGHHDDKADVNDHNHNHARDAQLAHQPATMGQQQQPYGANPDAYPPQQGYGNAATVGNPNDPYAHHTAGGPGLTGAGAGAGATGANQHVPPASHINNSADPHSAHGGGLSGKAESALGTLVGSQALKNKGEETKMKARAYEQQSAEIREAERLEEEAIRRRERAVAHGAHPDNSNLGGVQNAQAGNYGHNNAHRM